MKLARCLLIKILLVGSSFTVSANSDIVVDNISVKELRDLLCIQASNVGFSSAPTVCTEGIDDGTVFVTSTTSSNGGNLLDWANALTTNTYTDGLTAADDICQYHADNASSPLTGAYKAWLSTDNVSAKARIGNSKWYLPDGTTLIANGIADLLSCTKGAGANECLHNGINQDEDGSALLIASTNPYTGTKADGGVDGTNTCSNWTSTNGNGTAGQTSEVGSIWTNAAPIACSSSSSLICFGQ